MLRPEQMSKVSVTGAKSVMNEVIETLHGMHLVHITEYDGSWEGFVPGTPLEGSDEASSKLVTVRAIESILDINEGDVGPTRSADLSNADERLEEIRTEVNDLDDRREELESRLRDIEERLDTMELFAALGIDLDLLWGYDSLEVLVGEGSAAAIDDALAADDGIDAHEVFSGDGTVAAFARPSDDGSMTDALVGVPFTAVEVPEESGDPETVVGELEHESQQIRAELDKIENELEALKLDTSAFILALEEELTVETQKSEAPLRFATTERSFVVEGWIPTDRFDAFEAELRDAVGDRIDVDEIERAQFTNGGSVHQETHEGDGNGGASAESAADAQSEQEAATDGGRPAASVATDGDETDGGKTDRVATDGGETRTVVTVEDDPPVIQNNSRVVHPFEVLVKAVNRPKYSEFDPTVLVFLTFPFFFGFMIGDVGYGALYLLMGYAIYRKFDSDAISDLGLVTVWMGLFTVFFGVLYGEIFGFHMFHFFWEPLGQGDSLIPKGLQDKDWAITWLILAVIAGWIQLALAYLIDFIEEYQIHGFKESLVESGSWFLMLNGIWLWIFSYHLESSKPGFLIGEEAVLNETTIALGFTGFPEPVGIVGLLAFFFGIALILSGPWYEVFEFLVPVVHVLSYTRLTAVLLSKAGMALAANLLYFGAYMDHGHFEFMYSTRPADVDGEVVFGGLSNMGTEISVAHLQLGLEGALLGLPVLIIAHLVVLAIGGTAALQAIRLEYVEFFEKFYEGGGKNYEPYGYERTYTNP